MPPSSTTASADQRSLLRRLWREPFLQFLAIGLLIFVIAEWRNIGSQGTNNTIRIDTAQISYLQNLYNVQYGFNPDAETLEFLINNYIRDEVLWREAMKLGLGQEDEIIRRRLVQKMEYVLEDSGVQATAKAEALQAWYQQHSEHFQQPAKVSFSQIYFSADNTDDAAIKSRVQTVLQQLTAGAEVQPNLGDRFPLEANYNQLEPSAVAQIFGQSPMATAVFNEPTSTWVGPFRSGLGWHLLKITERRDSSVLPYSAVAEQVFNEWQADDNRQRAATQLKALIDRYQIIRTP